MSLLDINCPALQNFEALLALCNIAGESEAHRRRILDEQGLSKIEHYMYEDHQMLRRAAVQCMTNLALSDKVADVSLHIGHVICLKCTLRVLFFNFETNSSVLKVTMTE